ncbi:MAG: DNA polymerase III subunit chi [Rhodobacterales bacterium]|nr:DNA polymerase III subunit chi [Rhodobacterales bacterium]MDX5500209.1 DNA polymerase III subunit chi [Rhodobacterales bacterium]
MGHALFFHLTRSSPEDVVRLNVTRALGMGWRVVIRSASRAALERLDERLWLDPEDSFLPHGLAGGPHDADQPVLLTQGTAMPNGARALLALDGAEVSADEVAALERAWIVFDGADPAAVEAARVQWRTLTGAGADAEYWSEASGRWQMQTAKRKT